MRDTIDQTPDARVMLRQACKDSGMPTEQIARKAGVEPSRIRNWWRKAGNRPRIDNFVAVANACGYRVVLVPDAESLLRGAR